MKTNKMADRYLNTNSNFIMVIIKKQSCNVGCIFKPGPH